MGFGRCKTCKKDDVVYLGEGDLMCMHCGQMYEWDIRNQIDNTASDKKYWGKIEEDPKNKRVEN